MVRNAAVEDFDADEDYDRPRIGRAVLWAGIALLSLLAAFAAAQSERGLRRITEALDSGPEATRFALNTVRSPGSTVTAAVAGADETRRLTESVRRLSADRDRLMARLDALERSVDATGSLPRTPSALPSRLPDPTPSVTFLPAPITQTPQRDLVAPDAALPAAGSIAPPPTAPTAAGSVAPSPAAATAGSIAAPQAALQSGAGESVVTRTEFGIDLGAAANIEALRGLWSTAKAQHGVLLEGLRPIVMVKETGGAGGIELRLVAGPLINAAAAARLCAVIAATGRGCQPSPFEGQRLALK